MMNSESEGWIYKDQPNDPIIELIRNHKCERCGTKTLFCDCWVEELCEKCKNLKIACACM